MSSNGATDNSNHVDKSAEKYVYTADNKRVSTVRPNGNVEQVIYVYGIKNEITSVCTIQIIGQAPACGPGDLKFAGRVIRQNAFPVTVDRLGSVVGGPNGVRSGFGVAPTRYYLPYGEQWNTSTAGPAFPGNFSFASYFKDQSTGLDYADHRFYNNSNGYSRFMTADPSGSNQDIDDPASWNQYAYVEGDPINLLDPNGTDISLPPIIPSSTPTCLTSFLKDVVGSAFQGPNAVNDFLNTDVGILGLTTWLENRQYGSQSDNIVWSGIAGTFVDRYNLPLYLKQAYGFSTGSLAQVVEQGSGVWNGGTSLSQGTLNTLVGIFNCPPASLQGDGRDCNGITQAFKIAQLVLKTPSVNAFAGSLFFASGSATPSTFYTKQQIGLTYAEGTLWRFWKIANHPKQPPSKPRPIVGPLPL